MSKKYPAVIFGAAFAALLMPDVTPKGHMDFGPAPANAQVVGCPPCGPPPKPPAVTDSRPTVNDHGFGRAAQQVAPSGHQGTVRSRCKFSAAKPADDDVFNWCRDEMPLYAQQGRAHARRYVRLPNGHIAAF